MATEYFPGLGGDIISKETFELGGDGYSDVRIGETAAAIDHYGDNFYCYAPTVKAYVYTSNKMVSNVEINTVNTDPDGPFMGLNQYERQLSGEFKDVGKYYDLSPDIVQASVNRVLNGPSTATLTLQNKNYKYDGLFMPMDTIAIWMKRDRELQVFSGYITAVPIYSVGNVQLECKCTLARLERLYWDPGFIFTSQKLYYDPATGLGVGVSGRSEVTGTVES